MKLFKTILVAILGLSLLLSFKKDHVNIWMVGDSTMAPKKKEAFPELGWGVALSNFLNSNATVHNHAVNGRSTLSFINENGWKNVTDSIQPGDYVIIQFGHNDEKTKADRHTEPFGSFKDNLKKFIADTRSHKATPVLCSSIVRRHFDSKGNLIDTHKDYIIAAQQVAKETGTDYVDMENLTRKLVLGMGPKDSKSIFNFTDKKQDSTHLNVKGANVVAKLFVDDAKKNKISIAKYFIDKK